MNEGSIMTKLIFSSADSDHSEPPNSRPRGTVAQRPGSVDDFSDRRSSDDVFQDRIHSTPSPAITISRSTNTSAEDLGREPLKLDKSTSTADLSSFFDSDQESGSVFNSSPEADAFRWRDPGERLQDSSNLTDSTKVEFLQTQLKSLEKQSPKERRKYSHTQRYWTPPLVMQDYLNVNELQRASSSPSLYGKDRN